MKVIQLKRLLNTYADGLDIEIATKPNKDEWYELDSLELTTNIEGNAVVVINTD